MADRDLYGASDRSYAIDRPQQTAFRNYRPSGPGVTPRTPSQVKANQDIQDLYVEGARRDIEGDYSNRQPGFGVGNLRTVRPPLNPFVNPRGMRKGIDTLDPTGPGWIDDDYYSPGHPIWGARGGEDQFGDVPVDTLESRSKHKWMYDNAVRALTGQGRTIKEAVEELFPTWGRPYIGFNLKTANLGGRGGLMSLV